MADRYEVTDRHTGRVVGTYKSRTRAYRTADAKDLAYGAVRYTVRPVYGAA